MTADLVYHFPPDVFEALVDAIPLITRGRKTVLTFFRGCGVDRDLLARLAARMDADDAFGKYPATREVLTHLNDRRVGAATGLVGLLGNPRGVDAPQRPGGGRAGHTSGGR